VSNNQQSYINYYVKHIVVQSNLDYPDLDYPDFGYPDLLVWSRVQEFVHYQY